MSAAPLTLARRQAIITPTVQAMIDELGADADLKLVRAVLAPLLRGIAAPADLAFVDHCVYDLPPLDDGIAGDIELRMVTSKFAQRPLDIKNETRGRSLAELRAINDWLKAYEAAWQQRHPDLR